MDGAGVFESGSAEQQEDATEPNAAHGVAIDEEQDDGAEYQEEEEEDELRRMKTGWKPESWTKLMNESQLSGHGNRMSEHSQQHLKTN